MAKQATGQHITRAQDSATIRHERARAAFLRFRARKHAALAELYRDTDVLFAAADLPALIALRAAAARRESVFQLQDRAAVLVDCLPQPQPKRLTWAELVEA